MMEKGNKHKKNQLKMKLNLKDKWVKIRLKETVKLITIKIGEWKSMNTKAMLCKRN